MDDISRLSKDRQVCAQWIFHGMLLLIVLIFYLEWYSPRFPFRSRAPVSLTHLVFAPAWAICAGESAGKPRPNVFCAWWTLVPKAACKRHQANVWAPVRNFFSVIGKIWARFTSTHVCAQTQSTLMQTSSNYCYRYPCMLYYGIVPCVYICRICGLELWRIANRLFTQLSLPDLDARTSLVLRPRNTTSPISIWWRLRIYSKTFSVKELSPKLQTHLRHSAMATVQISLLTYRPCYGWNSAGFWNQCPQTICGVGTQGIPTFGVLPVWACANSILKIFCAWRGYIIPVPISDRRTFDECGNATPCQIWKDRSINLATWNKEVCKLYIF